jgi:DNA-binding response OmpR family regulator
MTRILIVEDEEKIARFIELELMHEGYEVIKANNGRTGLEISENGKVDLVILDVMLPEINGLEVLRRIRKTSDIPIIMLTARDAVMDKVAGLTGSR